MSELELIRNMLSYYTKDNLDESKLPYDTVRHLGLITERLTALVEAEKQGSGYDHQFIADFLETYNEWRRRGEGEQPNPKELGLAIDATVIVLRALPKEEL